MHFTYHTKVNDNMEFHYYKNFLKILVAKMNGLCNWMSLMIKWVKQHGFSNSLVINRICPFWLICSYKGESQNPKCVVMFLTQWKQHFDNHDLHRWSNQHMKHKRKDCMPRYATWIKVA
jgi:hypothetical protein